jgi:hypothetical protein
MGAVWNESSLNDEGMHGGYFNLPQAWTKAAKGGGR